MRVPQREKITAVRSLRKSPLGTSDIMGESCEKSITIALRPKSSRSAVPANSEKTSRHPTTLPPLMHPSTQETRARLYVARIFSVAVRLRLNAADALGTAGCSAALKSAAPPNNPAPRCGRISFASYDGLPVPELPPGLRVPRLHQATSRCSHR